MQFQLIQVELNEDGQVVATTRTLPLFDLQEDATAMAEFAATRCGGEYGYDAESERWWARDADGRMLTFDVVPALARTLGIAA